MSPEPGETFVPNHPLWNTCGMTASKGGGLHVWLKRDDLVHLEVLGNKWRT